jgi:hypothetical protein
MKIWVIWCVLVFGAVNLLIDYLDMMEIHVGFAIKNATIVIGCNNRN